MRTLLLLVAWWCLAVPTTGQTDFYRRLSEAALDLTRQKVVYDPAYRTIAYPLGDVPPDRGVCTDVIVRAYRKVGIDLQQDVHEDMKAHFGAYPARWGLKRPDPNIDHRRVPNLMTFFKRRGAEQPATDNPSDYRAGDVVCWDLGGGVTHIGLVVDKRSANGKRPMIVHNIGAGQVMEDVLLAYRIVGHYRYGGRAVRAP